MLVRPVDSETGLTSLCTRYLSYHRFLLRNFVSLSFQKIFPQVKTSWSLKLITLHLNPRLRESKLYHNVQVLVLTFSLYERETIQFLLDKITEYWILIILLVSRPRNCRRVFRRAFGCICFLDDENGGNQLSFEILVASWKGNELIKMLWTMLIR